MACPNCGHTMQCLSAQSAVYWCSRCGSVRYGMVVPSVAVPALVDRCKKFAGEMSDRLDRGDAVEYLAVAWGSLGIKESLSTGGQSGGGN